MDIRNLTDEQIMWFQENFCKTKNQELADTLGTSPRSITRMARKLGLQKTGEFMAAMQRNASERGASVVRSMGGNAGARNLLIYGKATRFKTGESHKDRMSEEARSYMYRRIGESRKEIFRKERRRVIFGLDQKTSLRVTRCPKEKIALRHKLRKHGYKIGRGSNEAVITDGTRRSINLETHAERMGIIFRFYRKEEE